MGEHTIEAIKQFQESQNLLANGDLDDNTRKTLIREHGF
jgi:peptidoglycan hydrolase-like protein with peptidoglycan-binding domain